MSRDAQPEVELLASCSFGAVTFSQPGPIAILLTGGWFTSERLLANVKPCVKSLKHGW